MEQTNGGKYITQRIFCWVVGIMITAMMAGYGYIFMAMNQNNQQTQSNTIMIGRLEERLDGILNTVIEIKDILREM